MAQTVPQAGNKFDREKAKETTVEILKKFDAWRGENEPYWSKAKAEFNFETPNHYVIGGFIATYFATQSYVPCGIVCDNSDSKWLRSCTANKACYYMAPKVRKHQDLLFLTGSEVSLSIQGRQLLYVSNSLPSVDKMADIKCRLIALGAAEVRFGSIWGPEALQKKGEIFSILTY